MSSEDEPQTKRSKTSGMELAKTEASANANAVGPMQPVAQVAAFNRLATAAHARMHDIPRPRVYVGNLDLWVSEQEIMQIFSAFGVVTGIDMPREGVPPQTRGFCFVEYIDQKMADKSIANLQDFMLGGRKLRVGQPTQLRRPNPGPAMPVPMPMPMPSAPMPAPSAASLPVPAPAPVSQVSRVEGDDSRSTASAGAGSQPSQASRPANGDSKKKPRSVEVLLMENLVAPGDADEDLAGEVGEECGRFGKVKKVRVHEMGKEKLVRVFVRFADPEDGGRAQAAMNGRWFGKRKVRATSYSKEAFVAGELEKEVDAE